MYYRVKFTGRKTVAGKRGAQSVSVNKIVSAPAGRPFEAVKRALLDHYLAVSEKPKDDCDMLVVAAYYYAGAEDLDDTEATISIDAYDWEQVATPLPPGEVMAHTGQPALLPL